MGRYPDEWVAIVDEQVVSNGKDLGKVLEIARIKTGKRHIAVDFIDCGDHIYNAG